MHQRKIFVLIESGPNREDIASAHLQHAMGLGDCLLRLGKMQQAEGADDALEVSIGKGQIFGVACAVLGLGEAL